MASFQAKKRKKKLETEKHMENSTDQKKKVTTFLDVCAFFSPSDRSKSLSLEFAFQNTVENCDRFFFFFFANRQSV